LFLALNIVGGTVDSAEQADFSRRDRYECAIKSKSGRYCLDIRHAVTLTVLKDQGNRSHVFSVSESPFSRVKDVKATCRGERLGKSHISTWYLQQPDAFFTENKTLTITFPQLLRAGDTLSYSYREQYDDIAFSSFFGVPGEYRLDGWDLKVEHPDDLEVGFRFALAADSLPVTVESPSAGTTAVHFGPRAPASKVDYFYDRSAAAIVFLDVKHRGGPSVTHLDPDRFATWYAGLTTLTPTLTEPQVPAEIGLSDPGLSSRGALAAINDFVRSHIRYVSEAQPSHSIVPENPAIVLDRRYGDCKDRAALVAALARHAGLSVHMCLVGPWTDWSHVATQTGMFNHVLCCWSDGGRDVFFDPTARRREFGNLPEEIVGRPALVLDPAHPRWVTIMPRDSLPSIEVHLTASTSGLDSARARLLVRGESLAHLRHLLDGLTGADLDNNLSDLLAAHLYKIGLKSFRLVQDAGPCAELTAEADLSEFLVQTSQRVYVPGLAFVVTDRAVLQRRDDPWPLVFGDRQEYVLSLTLDAPGFVPVADSLVLRSPMGAAVCADAIAAEGAAAAFTWTYSRQCKRLADKGKTDYLAFVEDYFAKKTHMFLLEATER
jgi:hypothetical protein